MDTHVGNVDIDRAAVHTPLALVEYWQYPTETATSAVDIFAIAKSMVLLPRVGTETKYQIQPVRLASQIIVHF